MARSDGWLALAIGMPICVAAGFAEAAAVGTSARDAVPPGPLLAVIGQVIVGAGAASAWQWSDATGRRLLGFAGGAAVTVFASAVSAFLVLPQMPQQCTDFCGLGTVFTVIVGGGLGLLALLVGMGRVGSREPGRMRARRTRNRRPQV